MQQRVVPQHLGSAPQAQAAAPDFTPHGGATYTPHQQLSPTFQAQQARQPQVIVPAQALPQPAPAGEPEPASPPQTPYAFITDPQNPLKAAPSALLNGRSLLARVAIFGGGVVGLLIVFSILKGLLGRWRLQSAPVHCRPTRSAGVNSSHVQCYPASVRSIRVRFVRG
jgi:hypothetical protein